MRIVALPDLHGETDGITAIQDVLSKVDLVLLVGDITKAGDPEDAIRVVRSIQQWNHTILAVPGNWDGPEVEHLLDEERINLHGRKAIVDQMEFWGIGASLPTDLHAPNEKPEEAFETITQRMRAEITLPEPYILVSHQPPLQTIHDKVSNGLHVGSKAVRKFIEETQPILCFTGHIHEGVGIDHIGYTTIINPGPLWQGGYAFVEISNNQVRAAEIRSK